MEIIFFKFLGFGLGFSAGLVISAALLGIGAYVGYRFKNLTTNPQN